MTAKRFGGVVGGATTAHSERVAIAMGGNIRSASSVLGAPWRTARREKLLQRRVSIAVGARSEMKSRVATTRGAVASTTKVRIEYKSPPYSSTHVDYTKHTMQSLSYVLALSEGMLDRLDLRVRRDRIAGERSEARGRACVEMRVLWRGAHGSCPKKEMRMGSQKEV